MSNESGAVESVINSFYKDSFQRDFLGYIVPGYLFWIVIWLANPKIFERFADQSDVVVASLTVLSIGFAYLTGVAIQRLGVFVGILRYYPLCENRDDA